MFVCIDLNSTGGIQTNTSSVPGPPMNNVTINLPSPINITGSHIGLVLDFLVSQSLSYPSCDTLVQGPVFLTPTFTLSSTTFAAQPTNSTNGLATDLEGLVVSVNSTARTFKVTAADGLSWTFSASGATVFQGISDFSGLVSGMPVTLDASIQADGSLLAARVSVADAVTTMVTNSTGPILQVAASEPVLLTFGNLLQGHVVVNGPLFYSLGNATFGISSQLTNLQSLPFPATFTPTNMVPGQRIDLTTHAASIAGGPLYEPAATVTLVPQTLNGVVSSISNDGSFATYTITLAPYDLFKDLAVQAGQLSLLQNPNTVVVYVDSSVQMLNTNPLAVGSTLRFYGLVFNDNGTLKMDCTQITDGVNQ